jgi:hypothetical protein
MTTNAIPLLLGLSVVINILFIWYLRNLLTKFVYVSENIYDLKTMVEIYQNHLEVVSELEMYFQDPNIEQLMKHTEDLLEQLKDYEEFYDLVAAGVSEIPVTIEEDEDAA